MGRGGVWWGGLVVAVQKPNSYTYKSLRFSGHNLESFQTCGFCTECLHYKPVLNHFCSRGGGGGGRP